MLAEIALKALDGTICNIDPKKPRRVLRETNPAFGKTPCNATKSPRG
jgi:hypothetical protein